MSDEVCRRVLYLTYDGLCDPIGQSQVLPYLVGCARGGHSISVISFEKAERFRKIGENVAAVCNAERLRWLPQRFHSFPPLASKLIDQWAMHRATVTAARQGTDLIHARSYVAGLAGLQLKRRSGAKLIFDMRGFWPDQRREGGRWRNDRTIGRFLYDRWKGHEREMVRSSDHIVVLTWAAKQELESWPCYSGVPISVIPCCADFELFQPATPEKREAARAKLEIPTDSLVLVHLGSIGTVYLLDQLLRLFDAVRRLEPSSRLLFVGLRHRDPIFAEAKRIGVDLGPAELHCVESDRSDVPYWLGAADIASCLITPTYSSLGVSPTKLAEYLACGIPVIGNRQVGDVERILQLTKAGHAIPDFSEASIAKAAHIAVERRGQDQHGIRKAARPLLDLPHAVQAYRDIYASPDKLSSIPLT